MAMLLRMDTALLGSPPKGCSVTHHAEGIGIEHARAGMGCMNAFLVVCLAGWTVGSFQITSQVLAGETAVWAAMAVWAGEMVLGCLTLYMLFARTVFRLAEHQLAIDFRLHALRRTLLVPRLEMRNFEQVIDGGEGDDSFPSSGLRLNRADRFHILIYRQPFETTEWFGKVLSDWYGVDFVKAPVSKRPKRGPTNRDA